MATIEVELNGKPLENVRKVTMELVHPAGDVAQPINRTSPLLISIRRDAMVEGTIAAFEAAANESGSISRITASVVLKDARNGELYNLDVKSGFVASYDLRQVTGSDDGGQGSLQEWIEIYAGDVTLTSGSDNHSFVLPRFNAPLV